MSRLKTPLTLHVPTARLASPRPVAWHVLARCRGRGEHARLRASFRFKNDERRFARQLARRKSNLWLFRSNQQGFCGDFVLVDMSSPDRGRRPIFVVDLKLGARLKLGGGGAGIQFLNASQAVEDIARRTGIIPREADYTLVTGDRLAVLGYLVAILRRRVRARRRADRQPTVPRMS